jgi:serralysin
VPGTTTVTPTGILAVDAVDSGTRWSTLSLTYSFPTSASFYTGSFGGAYGSGEPLSNFRRLHRFSKRQSHLPSPCIRQSPNLTFTQITETSTQTATLRFAESDKPATAWTYYPSSSPEGGDSWFSNSAHYYDNPAPGNYAFKAIMHEIGHGLGLKHPHDVSGAFGAIPADQDSGEYSVMSYRSYVGAPTNQGYTNETWGYPQTLMMYDIAAIQQMYGANFNYNGGNTVYKWDPNTGQEFVNGVGQATPGANRIFMTVWDGGGNDTYDFSNYTTNLSVNLQPGGWTTASTAQLAYLGNGHYAIGNIANALLYQNNPASLIENAIGGSGNDTSLVTRPTTKLPAVPAMTTLMVLAEPIPPFFQDCRLTIR